MRDLKTVGIIPSKLIFLFLNLQISFFHFKKYFPLTLKDPFCFFVGLSTPKTPSIGKLCHLFSLPLIISKTALNSAPFFSLLNVIWRCHTYSVPGVSHLFTHYRCVILVAQLFLISAVSCVSLFCRFIKTLILPNVCFYYSFYSTKKMVISNCLLILELTFFLVSVVHFSFSCYVSSLQTFKL